MNERQEKLGNSQTRRGKERRREELEDRQNGRPQMNEGEAAGMTGKREAGRIDDRKQGAWKQMDERTEGGKEGRTGR